MQSTKTERNKSEKVVRQEGEGLVERVPASRKKGGRPPLGDIERQRKNLGWSQKATKRTASIDPVQNETKRKNV